MRDGLHFRLFQPPRQFWPAEIVQEVGVLEVNDLHVSYGGVVRALQGVSLQVPEGKVVAVLGSNGAGKSTLMRTVSATLRMHQGAVVSGDISFGGTSLAGLDAARTVRLGIVQVPEGRRIFGRLTVEENLRAGGLGARERSGRSASRDQVFDMFPVLAERRRQRAALLSGGEQQMLAIGRALMAKPKLMILDEPSLGLAPRIVGQIGRILRAINSEGTSVLLVEQNAVMALGVADTAYVLDVGRVSLSGPADQLATDDTVRQLYLGHAAQPAAAGDREARPHAALSRWRG
jgi:branched-chain amino acid transport system ATP-binding protein